MFTPDQLVLLDPTPEDNQLTLADWISIGIDCVLAPALGGMGLVLVARLLPGSAVPVGIIGVTIIPSIVALILVANPKNRLRSIFMLLCYIAGLASGSWDLLIRELASNMLATVLALGTALVLAWGSCMTVKNLIRHGE